MSAPSFGETKEYLFGKISHTHANNIHIIRVFGEIVYERYGKNARLFKTFKVSNSYLSTFVGKLISTLLILVFAVPLFLTFTGMFLYCVWFIPAEKSDL